MDEVENFFCQFPNPWALRVSGMGGYISKCEKSQNHCTLIYSLVLECAKFPAKLSGFVPRTSAGGGGECYEQESSSLL
jgi:hypothetical protein